MDFINLDYQENKNKTASWIDQDTQLKEPSVLDLPEAKISLGIKKDNKIIARLLGNIFFNGFHIELFATDPNYRSGGYGKALLDYALTLAKSKGAHFVTLETMSFNAPKFYLKNDFEVLKEISNSPIDGTSHFLMYRDLQDK